MASLKWQAVGKVRGGLPLLLTLLSLVVALTAGSALAAAPGVWDLGEGNAVIRNTPYATVYNMVLSGYNGGLWDGPGINSSAAAAPANLGVTALATVLNDIGGSPIWTSGADIGPEFNIAGLDPLTTSDIIIKYTYYGDADLNGNVDLDDFFLITFGSSDGWLFGDFDYSSSVDLDDFFLWAGNLGQSGLSGGAASPVPEPSTLAMFVALAIFAFAWFRR